jgi:class 3 adenylate cyclase/pimeloyl-ACP methyl ester carboxylesterase
MERRLAAIVAADVAGYSRLMRADEAGTLAALQGHLAEAIGPAIARHRGRIVKLMGDGLLAEFASVVEGVSCAIEIQAEMDARNAGTAADRRMALRIGVHLGDIMADGDDIFGDGVNIAARLQQMADAGGVLISRQAREQIDRKLAGCFAALGPKRLKNIAEPIDVFAYTKGEHAADTRQEIRYCRAEDGTRLAYAISGSGPVLLKAGNWLNHLEYDWESIAWSHVLHELSRDHTLVRYDARGNGLSDRTAANISFDAWVSDLEAVANAAGLDRFPLLGISQGCALAVAYAVRNPERVTHLVFYGGYARGRLKRARTDEEREHWQAMRTLLRLGWGADNPSFRQIFTTSFMPEATKEQMDAFNELQRRTASAEYAVRHFEVAGSVDITNLLDKVRVPTLVMHARNDLFVPVEMGRELAAGIPGARFITLESRNHIFLAGEPAATRFFRNCAGFWPNRKTD